jgi:hypothetical protein
MTLPTPLSIPFSNLNIGKLDLSAHWIIAARLSRIFRFVKDHQINHYLRGRQVLELITPNVTRNAFSLLNGKHGHVLNRLK